MRKFGNRKFDDFDGPQLFETTCSECGDLCEVPFKPNGRKPVFCRDCFKKNEFDNSYDDRKSFQKPRFEKPRFEKPRFDKPKENYKEEFERLNFKMDMILKALTQLGETKSALPAVEPEPVEKPKAKRKKKAD